MIQLDKSFENYEFICYYIFIIEHIINYNIPCLILALEECGHLLDDLVAQ